MLSAVLVGCSVNFTTSAPTTTTFMTSQTTVTPLITSEVSVDLDQIKADIYQRIYSEMYDEIRAQVIANLSQDEFDRIYNEVVTSLLDKIAAGEIEVTAATVADMILNLAADEATAVVGVSVYNSDGTTLQAIGSGVIYKKLDNTYYVVTNNHVVADGSVYKIRLEDGTEIDATLRGVDSLVDIAVLYFNSNLDLKVVSFGDSSTVEKGTIVVAVGNPSGYEYYRSITMGVVSGTNRYFDIDSDGTKDMFVGYIQHDASINAGNSGGALFNLQGEVIGINVIKIADVAIEGMGFAIPSSLVKDICADIEAYGVSLQKPVLGISFIDISTNREYLIESGVTIPNELTAGFYIDEVVTNSSVDGYVQSGDIIIQIGDITITNTSDFVTQFSKYRVGDLIDIVVIRNGQTLTFSDVELKPRPEA